jgi:hypothetical protein
MSEGTKPDFKTCPRCGKQFECLHAAGCWCFDYTISLENQKKLKEEFDNCLCPECLPLYAENSSNASN